MSTFHLVLEQITSAEVLVPFFVVAAVSFGISWREQMKAQAKHER